jgi:hypothetical protein
VPQPLLQKMLTEFSDFRIHLATKMSLNCSFKLLRLVVAGCISMLFLSTILYSRYPRQFSVLQVQPQNSTITSQQQWIPSWTTEQLEPKFAYAQYVTNLDYLCNAVSKALLIKFIYQRCQGHQFWPTPSVRRKGGSGPDLPQIMDVWSR